MRRDRRKLSSYASHRCQTATLAHPLDAHLASGIAALWAKKRTSGFAAISGNRVKANTLASPDRIREKSPLLYDLASDACVAKSDLCLRAVRTRAKPNRGE
jgi:hypothetical protein